MSFLAILGTSPLRFYDVFNTSFLCIHVISNKTGVGARSLHFCDTGVKPPRILLMKLGTEPVRSIFSDIGDTPSHLFMTSST